MDAAVTPGAASQTARLPASRIAVVASLVAAALAVAALWPSPAGANVCVPSRWTLTLQSVAASRDGADVDPGGESTRWSSGGVMEDRGPDHLDVELFEQSVFDLERVE